MQDQPQKTDATPGQTLYLDPPAEAISLSLAVEPGQLIGARFNPADVEVTQEGGNLVITFANGGEIVLTGYEAALAEGDPAMVIFADGSAFSEALSLTLQDEDTGDLDVDVASGPDGNTPLSAATSGGAHGYGENLGQSLSGLAAAEFLGNEGGNDNDDAVGPGARAPEPDDFDPPVDLGVLTTTASPFGFGVLPAAPPPAPINLAPVLLALDTASVDENSAVGTLVGTVSTQDPNIGDSHSYLLTDDAGGLFDIDAVTGAITVAGGLDFESASSHQIKVLSADDGGLSREETRTIAVNDLIESLVGDGRNNTLRGGAGKDLIDGKGGNDRLYGNGADDQLLGGDGKDRLYGGGGNDLLKGENGADQLYGEAGDDQLFGEAGNDKLYGGAGSDELRGGDGNDWLYIDGDDTVIEGGAGTDRVVVQGSTGITLNLTASSIEIADGNTGDDVFDATGTTVATTQYGRGGNDQLTGGTAADRLYGHGDDDILIGNGGNDRLYGGSGNDQLTGGDGRDQLRGDAGADQLIGGLGNDRLYIDADDTAIDGGDGRDRVDVVGGTGVTLNLAASSIEIANGNAGDDTFDGSGMTVATTQYGRAGDDQLTGGVAADRLYGHNDDDILIGNGGNDRLYGGNDNDQLFGGTGRDQLRGEGGNDQLIGGTGNDTLIGGGGDDEFFFDLTFAGGKFAAEGKDTVNDLSTTDILTLRGVLDVNGDLTSDLDDLAGHVTVQDKGVGKNVTLKFDGGGSIILKSIGTGSFNDLDDLVTAGYQINIEA